MRGLENAHILRPGYAIEYDYFDPRALKSSFETKSIGGCSSPGRSTDHRLRGGGGPGLFAGLNAALQVQGARPGRRGATRPTSACWSTT
jgi:tRNA uridine 5-carboxymethylaminomethyl modification enzyme